MEKKPTSSPVSVQTYINGEFIARDATNDNHSTLPIRSSESIEDVGATDRDSRLDTGQPASTLLLCPTGE